LNLGRALLAALLLLLPGCDRDRCEPVGTNWDGSTPLSAALSRLGPRNVDTFTTSTIAGYDVESPDEVNVIVTLLVTDGAIHDERHDMYLLPEGTTWRVVADDVTYRCSTGLGDRRFSSKPCSESE
jgi:hypothetical protein